MVVILLEQDFGNEIWKDSNGLYNLFNRFNEGVKDGIPEKTTYSSATFGLVKGLDLNGNIIYSDGIAAPKLFNESESDENPTKGKKTYSNYSLSFNRNGDTYVLNSVKNDITQTNILNNLSRISNNRYFYIWTNDFWPMDYATDENGNSSFGTDGHDLKFGDYGYAYFRRYGENIFFDASDELRDHNAYFGMQLSIDFYMVEDYIGPLEYYFFGDDDLWVFLDGNLICDLGGVHTSVGEYVNLWDYIPNGDTNKHTLSIFYTERGAYGSTCWMHFNLPHPLAESTSKENCGNLSIIKDVINIETTQKFNFEIILTDEDGKPLESGYSYISNKGRNGRISSGGVVGIESGEKITILNIPEGTRYSVKEIGTETTSSSIPFEQFVSGSENANGTIKKNTESDVKFTNAYNYTFAKVEKNWDDDNNGARVRPESGISVKLIAKIGNEVVNTYVTSVKPDVQFEINLNENNDWKFEWQNLPKYRITKNGDIITKIEEITYIIDEVETEELKENYFVLSKTVRDNTTIITNASYKSIILAKVDTEDETKTLAGAQFKLEKLLNDDDDTDMTVDTTFEPIISEVTGEDGKFTFEKLKFGRYQLTEIKTPEGYNTIKKPIVINVRQNTIKVTNPTALIEQITEYSTDGKLVIDLGKIGNRKGITLTETGGTGTKIFTIAGLAIIVISLSLLNPKQKISLSESARQRRKNRMAKKNI